MNFKKLDLNQANRLINHGPTILVTAKHEGTINLMTAAWCMPVSKKPPMLAVAIGHSRFTHGLIIKSGEFSVCIPGRDLVELCRSSKLTPLLLRIDPSCNFIACSLTNYPFQLLTN